MYIGHGICGIWRANWYAIGLDQTTECVIVDPGPNAKNSCRASLSRAGRVPMAVLATHGHIDHVADAAAVADYFDIPLYIHQADRRFLTEPAQACNRVGRKFKLDEVLKGPFVEPRQVVEYQIEGSTGRGELDVAGMEFKLRHAPGHTPGCVLVILEGNRTRKTIVFCGDVVFAGSIGRTNFEVSDHQAMLASLRDQLLTLPDSSALLPGHGPATLLGHERATNPFLRPEFLDAK